MPDDEGLEMCPMPHIHGLCRAGEPCTQLERDGSLWRTKRTPAVDEPPPRCAVEQLVAAAPNLAPEYLLRLRNVRATAGAALADGRVDEVGRAWLRTVLAKVDGDLHPDAAEDLGRLDGARDA